jgi:hypothetical protein
MAIESERLAIGEDKCIFLGVKVEHLNGFTYSKKDSDSNHIKKIDNMLDTFQGYLKITDPLQKLKEKNFRVEIEGITKRYIIGVETF